MRPESHTARAYLMADRVIRAFENWLVGKVKAGCCYAPAAISRRLAQAVSMQFTNPFLRMSMEEPLQGKVDRLEELPKYLSCGKLKINNETGAVSPHLALSLLCGVKFLALWLLVLWHYLLSFTYRNVGYGAAILVYGVPSADLCAGGRSRRFEEFCEFGPLDVLRKSNRIIVHASPPIEANNYGKFSYSKYPLLTLFAKNRLGLADGIQFVWRHFYACVNYLALVSRLPIACLLWRDYAEHACVEALNSKGLIEANIITNTNWLQQLLWNSDLQGKTYKSYMALYSLNSSQLLLKDDPVRANHPGIRHLRVDCVWVWNHSYSEVLRCEGVSSETQVVGPILWYLPTKSDRIDNAKFGSVRVTLFDVSPQNQKHLIKHGLLNNYYKLETVKKFIDDSLSAIDEVGIKLGFKVEVILKHKRKPAAIHDMAYFDYVNHLSKTRDGFRFASEDANLFSLISGSDLIIVIPYSSPAYIAEYVCTTAIFYDPTGELKDVIGDTPHILFSSGIEDLVEKVTMSLTSKYGREVNCVK